MIYNNSGKFLLYNKITKMKKILWITALLIAIIAIAITFNFSNANATNNTIVPQDKLTIDFPEDVTAILERSCFDCHTNDASNFKAKGKLNFSKWDEYKPSKKISKLGAICEEITDGKMPTKKYKNKYPDKSLSKEEIDLICNWADEESKKLLGE